MSKTFRLFIRLYGEFESESDRVRPCRRPICSSEQFSFQTCLESGGGSGTSVTGDREFQTAGAVILKALDWKLIHRENPQKILH